jgi:hypothetical protein
VQTRRSFFGTLGGAAAAFALDPERALWVQGAKTISVPAPSIVPFEPAVAFFGLGDIITIEGRPGHFVVTTVSGPDETFSVGLVSLFNHKLVRKIGAPLSLPRPRRRS